MSVNLVSEFRVGSDRTRSHLVSQNVLAELYSIAEATFTQQQHEAAAALINHTNEDILTWLKLARSARIIEPLPEQRPEIAHLSPSQIHALFALKDCPNDRLLRCLELARLSRLYNDIVVYDCSADSL